LSPEQVALHDLSAASDVFSLGSLLAFAATGRPPFGQGATVAVLLNIQRNEPDLDGIDPTRKVLLERILAKEPAARPTAREILDVARGMRNVPDDATMAINRSHTTAPIVAPVAQPLVPPPVNPVPPAVTSAPARKKRSAGKPLAVLAALVIAAGVGYAGFNSLDSGASPEPTRSAEQQASEEPAGPTQAPADPGSDQLRSGDWLLSRYSISQDNGKLVINGTVQNSGDQAASTTLTVFYYVNGEAVAVATGQTGEVAAGGSAQVTLTSDDDWQPGNPTLVVEAS
jgi:serine/threonine protein kinase